MTQNSEVEQWLARLAHNQKVGGSTPLLATTYFIFVLLLYTAEKAVGWVQIPHYRGMGYSNTIV